MKRNKKGATPKGHTHQHTAKIDKMKDIAKVLLFFSYTLGTTLDCAKSTGILRNCITWYVKDLEHENLLQAVCRRKDSSTGFMAKHYSSDKALWKPKYHELSLFPESEANNGL
jgi:hypothetical protein